MLTRSALADAAHTLGLDVGSKETRVSISARIAQLLAPDLPPALPPPAEPRVWPAAPPISEPEAVEEPQPLHASESRRTIVDVMVNPNGSGVIDVFRDGRQMHKFAMHKETF